MTIVLDRTEPRGDIYGYVRRLESLIAHLRKLNEGKLPTSEDLARAPLLNDYQHAIRASECLVGYVEGHPRIDGAITTSELWTFAPDLGWARTLSRLYRLGRPAGASDHLQ